MSERIAKGWALFTSNGHVFQDSVRRLRSQVVQYADNDAAPGWTWEKYRKRGFYIAKVEVRALPDGGVDG